MDKDYFDFKSISEEPESLDFKNLEPCPKCRKSIPSDATMCLYCGEEVYRSSPKPVWVVWTAIILIIIFASFFLMGL